jgi:DNA replication protein DnaC
MTGMTAMSKTTAPPTREALHALLHELNFKGMARVLDTELDRAERQAVPAAEVVQRLLAEQASHQRERSLLNRLANAHLPWQWTIDTFPFAQQSGVNKAQIIGLAGLDFVRRAENLVLIGGPGTGKTGIALGLLRQACINGWRARFYSAQALLDELYASLADRSTTRLLTALSRMQPLCIDELGYLNLKTEQVNAFFRLMDQRYGRVSTIITTNLDYPAWYALFDNKPLVDALLDRLQHHCITIRIDGPSLRASTPCATPAATPPSPTGSSPSAPPVPPVPKRGHPPRHQAQ